MYVHVLWCEGVSASEYVCECVCYDVYVMTCVAVSVCKSVLEWDLSVLWCVRVCKYVRNYQSGGCVMVCASV